ncbi:MAG: hypothetical protein K0Q59_5194 [Paenibacillus sp.]|nr:hypothetical protein [Paenibacillus sp.]
MSFQTHTPNKQSSPASANKSAQSKQENDTAPKAENSFGLTGSMSARRMMQLQRTMGNQAVQRMVSGAAAPHTAIQRSPAAPVAAPAPAPQAAPQRLPASADPKSLRSLGEYWGIYQWLKNEADASGKSALFGYFDNLSKGAKMAAIKKMADDDRPDLYKVKEKMITGIFSKKFDWGKFSEFSREANAADTQNYNADQDRDYASYAAIGTSSAAGGVSGSAKISSELGGAKGAVPVGLNAAPVAAGSCRKCTTLRKTTTRPSRQRTKRSLSSARAEAEPPTSPASPHRCPTAREPWPALR